MQSEILRTCMSIALIGILSHAHHASAQANGQNAKFVAAINSFNQATQFVETSPKVWTQSTGNVITNYNESQRDAWSIYLLRKIDGHAFSIDLYKKAVYDSVNGATLFTVTSSSTQIPAAQPWAPAETSPAELAPPVPPAGSNPGIPPATSGTGIPPNAGSPANFTPFDTAASGTEQTRFYAHRPELVGRFTNNTLYVAYNKYAGNQATGVGLTALSAIGNNFQKSWDRTLPLDLLGGLTTTSDGAYSLSVKSEHLLFDMSANNFRPNVSVMQRYDRQGNAAWTRDVNSQQYLGSKYEPQKGEAKAIYSPMNTGTAALASGNGRLAAVMASNTLPDIPINSRHQRAQFFAVGTDGSGVASSDESSWRHSFDQRVIFDGTDFIIADLADAGWYMAGPGITLRKLSPSTGQPAPEWLNQGVYVYVRAGEKSGGNYTFTSLGGVVASQRGYTVVFTSEKNNHTAAGRDGWQSPVVEPRNLGLVHVVRDFDTRQRNEFSVHNLIDVQQNGIVDSQGATSGLISRLDKSDHRFRSAGVVWLTNLPNGVSAERPKVVNLGGNESILLWEEWTYSGQQLSWQSTKAMLIDEYGSVLRPAVTINSRLNPSGADVPFEMNGRAAWIMGSGSARQLTLHQIDRNLQLTSSPLPM